MNPYQPLELRNCHIQNIVRADDEQQQLDQNGNEPEKCCWICYETEQERHATDWVAPCHCRGTTKWAHESCLLRWVEEKQRGSRNRPVFCPQCLHKYEIVYPQVHRYNIIEEYAKFASFICSLLLGTGVAFILYLNFAFLTKVNILEYLDYRSSYNTYLHIYHVFVPLLPIFMIMKMIACFDDVFYEVFMQYPPFVEFMQDFGRQREVQMIYARERTRLQHRQACRMFYLTVMLTVLALITGELAFYTDSIFVLPTCTTIMTVTKVIAIGTMLIRDILVVVHIIMSVRQLFIASMQARRR